MEKKVKVSVFVTKAQAAQLDELAGKKPRAAVVRDMLNRYLAERASSFPGPFDAQLGEGTERIDVPLAIEEWRMLQVCAAFAELYLPRPVGEEKIASRIVNLVFDEALTQGWHRG